MKKRMLCAIFVAFMVMSLTACGGGDSTTPPADAGGTTQTAPEDDAPQPPELTGSWKQVNSGSDDAYQTAVITGDTIEIYWTDATTDTNSLYWAGSFVAPTTADEPYTWDSKNDKSKTSSALLASGDDTKTITYENGQISYSASAMGSTQTVKLERTGDAPAAAEPQAEPAAASDSGAIGDYDVKIGGCSFGEDYDGKKMIVINYDFTNNSDETIAPLFALDGKAFQDGVQLETAFSMDDTYDAGIEQKELKPGATLQGCQKAYTLTSESPVEFEIGELFGDTVLTKTFEVQ